MKLQDREILAERLLAQYVVLRVLAITGGSAEFLEFSTGALIKVLSVHLSQPS
jgi:hypothetical protein